MYFAFSRTEDSLWIFWYLQFVEMRSTTLSSFVKCCSMWRRTNRDFDFIWICKRMKIQNWEKKNVNQSLTMHHLCWWELCCFESKEEEWLLLQLIKTLFIGSKCHENFKARWWNRERSGCLQLMLKGLYFTNNLQKSFLYKSCTISFSVLTFADRKKIAFLISKFWGKSNVPHVSKEKAKQFSQIWRTIFILFKK